MDQGFERDHFAATVRLHLLAAHAGSLLKPLTIHISERRGTVAQHWDEAWRQIALVCLRLAAWEGAVAHTPNPLAPDSRAAREGRQLHQLNSGLEPSRLWSVLDRSEAPHVASLLGVVAELVAIYGGEAEDEPLGTPAFSPAAAEALTGGPHAGAQLSGNVPAYAS